jgi:NAD(P)H-hydrate epimerase
MNVVSTEQIRELDRRAIEEAGIPGVVLMENAGAAVVELIEREYGSASGKCAAVFCGPGNNGGDGFVIARRLMLSGALVDVYCEDSTLEPGRVKADAAAHLQALQSVGYKRGSLPIDKGASTGLTKYRTFYDFVVDALLGTGIKSAPRGWIADAIDVVNALDCPVVAVDIPSGVDADSGGVPGAAVWADWTVTFACPKVGLFLHPGYERVGQLHVSDIGFPWESLSPQRLELGAAPNISLLGCTSSRISAAITCSRSLLEPAGWETLLQKRQPETNKGDYGHVGIIAGSRGMTGAAALSARAAQRAGAGLVTVLTAASAQPIVAGKLDEQMTVALPEADGALAEAALDPIIEFARKADVLCIGPGLSTRPETVLLVKNLVRSCDVPIVLDADGLNAIAMNPDAALERKTNLQSPLIMTPHPGEAARLLGTTVAEIQADRIGSARRIADRYHATVVLKGRYSLIADPDGSVCINTTGNPGMATGGMGDTLTGIIGSLVAQDLASRTVPDRERTSILSAVALGVHLHGIAGDIAADARGEAGIVAGDVIDCLPAARSRLVPEA